MKTNTSNTLLLSRINSPQLPAYVYSRPRLLNLLINNQYKKLIVISSPAGYGKTTLALEYLNAVSKKYAWANLSEAINHPFSFYFTIIHALKKIMPGFGEDTLTLLDSHLEKNKFTGGYLKNTINDITSVLCSEYCNFFTDNTALVLDDYHHIEGLELRDYIVDMLIQNMPNNFQLVITSRQLPELDFTYYIINEMLFKIEMEDLVFSDIEAADLISTKYNIDHPEKITELASRLGGWITGLHMVSQGFSEAIESITFDKQPIPENIFNFLAEAAFNKFDEETKEMLLVTSVIENFHSELCKSAGIVNFDKIISPLLEKNTFIQTIPIIYPDGTKILSYNYINLFSNFLKAKLLKDKTTDDIKKIYRSVYRYYENKLDFMTAINYMIKAEDYTLAAIKINENYKDLFSEGKIEFLWNWLNSLPPAELNNNAESLLNYASLQKFYAGDFESAVKSLNQVIIKARDESSFKLLVRAHILKAIILQNLGQTKYAIEELKLLLHDRHLTEYIHVIKYYLAYELFHISDYGEAERLLAEMENSGHIDNDIFYSTYKLMGHINLIRGNYTNAINYYEKALKDEHNIIDKIEVLCNLVLLSSQSAEYSKAERYLNELDNLIIRFPASGLKVPHLLARQAFLFEKAQYKDALIVMKNILEETTAINHRQYAYLSSRLITECCIYDGNLQEAEKYYKISLEYLDTHNKLKSIETNVLKTFLFDLPFSETENILLTAYHYYKENALLYNLAQLCYYIADFYHKQSKTKEYDSYINECMEISYSNGYRSFLLREYKKDSRLLDLSLNFLKNKQHIEFINYLKIVQSN